MTDTGFGIPKENLDKIFDPFFVGSKLTKGTSWWHGGIVRGTVGLNVYSQMNWGTTFKGHLCPFRL